MSDYLQDRARQARKNELIRKGANEEQAEKIIARQEKSARETGRIFFGMGIFMLVVAVGATGATFLMSGGAVYLVAVGLLLGGVGNTAYGWNRMKAGV